MQPANRPPETAGRNPSKSIPFPPIPLPTLILYTTPECHLCQQALAALGELRAELGFELQECDITLDDALHRAYLERVPVGTLDGEELFEYFVDPDILRERLGTGGASSGSVGQTRDPGRAGSPR